MEGGSENDLLSLDQTISGENGDKAAEGDEKRGKDKKSESRDHAKIPVRTLSFYVSTCA